MVDNYKLQATYFANVLTHQTNAIACVHLEDSEDKPFWNTLLQSHRSGFYYYITYSRSKKGNDTSGCEQYRNGYCSNSISCRRMPEWHRRFMGG